MLRRGVDRAEGFALFLAVCDLAVKRKRLIEQLTELLPGRAVHRVNLPPDCEDVLAECLRQVGEPRGPLMLSGLEDPLSTGRGDALLQTLNLGRPEWPRTLPVPVVFWVSEAVARRLLREAPDFWDWRSDTVEFESSDLNALTDFELSAVARGPIDYNPTWSAVSLLAGERDERLSVLRERISTLERRQDRSSRVLLQEAYEQAAELLQSRGRVAQAERLLTGWALPLAREIGEWVPIARTLRRLAGLQVEQGRLEDAEKNLQEVLLDHPGRGASQSWAFAQSELARIFAYRGEISKALTLLEEVRAVFEALGDSRSRAVTLADLAGLLESLGRLEEATNLTQEALAVFQRLGDGPATAVTLVHLAQLRASQGEITLAIELLKEALSLYRRIGDKLGQAWASWALARLETDRGNLEPARELAFHAFEVGRELGDLRVVGGVGLFLGRLLGMRGEAAMARDVLEQALAAFRQLGSIDQADRAASALAALPPAAGSA